MNALLSLPLIILLFCLLVLKMKTSKASSLAVLSYVLPTSFVMIAMQFVVITFKFIIIGRINEFIIRPFNNVYIIFSQRKTRNSKKRYKNSLTLSKALLPYGMIIAFSLLFQIIDLEQYYFSFKYPAFSTKLCYAVAMEKAYSKIKIFDHPAPIMIMSSIAGIIVYMKAGIWENKKFINLLDKTVNKCITTTISPVFLITMVLLMMDSGMTNALSLKISEITGNGIHYLHLYLA